MLLDLNLILEIKRVTPDKLLTLGNNVLDVFLLMHVLILSILFPQPMHPLRLIAPFASSAHLFLAQLENQQTVQQIAPRAKYARDPRQMLPTHDEKFFSLNHFYRDKDQ